VHGFITEGHDSLMKVLDVLLESPQLRLQVGAAACEHVRANFSQEVIGRRWETLYERVTRQHRQA